MTSFAQLADQVSRTDPKDLLPHRLSTEDAAIPTRLELVDSLPLGGSMQLLLLQSAETRYAAPVIAAADELRRVEPGTGAAAALIDLLVREPSAASAFSLLSFDRARAVGGERAMLVDQTHESVVVGEAAVVKWMVRAEASPAPTLIAHLSSLGFTDIPQPWGFVSWSGEEPVVMATVTDFLPGAVDGWTWCVDDVGSYSRGQRSLESAVEPAAAIGDLIGRMHVALATPSRFLTDTPSSADEADVAGWRAAAHSTLEQAVDCVVGDEGERLRARVDRIASAIDGSRGVRATPTIPVHGDLHVGQILRWEGGYAVNDFDGNPVLSAHERLHPQPAARDVAGMLQSLDHVGEVVMRRVEGVDRSLVSRWIASAQEAFMSAYQSCLQRHDHPSLLDERLLLPFRVEQECREFVYAEKHLPRWRYVPDASLQTLFP